MLSLQNAADLQLLQPFALWWLIPLLGLCAFVLVRRAALRTYAAILALIISLLVFALADPVKSDKSTAHDLVALIDSSQSVTPTGRSELLSALLPYLQRTKATLHLLPFGKEASDSPVELPASASLSEVTAAMAAATKSVNGSETDLAAALNSAAIRYPNSPVLLLSDGYETSGNARQMARMLQMRGSPIFPLIRNEDAFLSQTLSISNISAPITVSAGDLAEVRVTVRNPSTIKPQSAALEIWFEEKKLTSQIITVNSGEERVITVKTPAVEGGEHRIRAILNEPTAGTTLSENHRWITGKVRSRILLLSGTLEDQRVLRQLLSVKGYALEDIVADGNTTIPTDFSTHSSVIINNVAAPQLPSVFLPNLKRYAEGGGGVLLVGGDRSFGLGRYIDTPLEEISPLKFVPPQTTKRRLNSAVVLLIDKSKSMAFGRRIDGARDAAMLTIEQMKDDDYISVIGFDAAPFEIIKLMLAPEARELASRRLPNLVAGGRTELLPGLSMAGTVLSKAPASRKHIIVLTDGKVPVTGNEYALELSRLSQRGITVSTVALSEEGDVPFLQWMADQGKGAFYHVLDPRRLPEIFVRDVKITTGERTLKEDQDYPIGIGISGLVSTGVTDYPPVRGFVETLPKKGASLELITRKEQEVQPILASWKFGAGKVVAFTSDANGRWSQPWIRWDGFTRFWSEIVEGLKSTGPENKSEVDFDVRFTVNRRAVTFDLAIFDQQLTNSAPPKISGEVTLPGGERKNISFLPIRTGRFSATIENGRPGDYHLAVKYGTVKLPPLAITLGGELFGEISGRGVNVQNLSEIAYLSGGSINPDPESLKAAERSRESFEHRYTPFVVIAFVLAIVAIFLRELGLAMIFGIFRFFKKQRTGGGRSGPVRSKSTKGIYEQRKNVA